MALRYGVDVRRSLRSRFRHRHGPARASDGVVLSIEDPRLAPVMLVLALTRVVQGFANSGVVAFRKELAFDREFR